VPEANTTSLAVAAPRQEFIRYYEELVIDLQT
jgi:hypothetical protein